MLCVVNILSNFLGFCSILFSFYGSFCLKSQNFTHENCCEPNLAKPMHDFESAIESTISDLESWRKIMLSHILLVIEVIEEKMTCYHNKFHNRRLMEFLKSEVFLPHPL